MTLADLLFGAYRRDVLGLLLLHPGDAYHVREIARMTGKPANTLYRELVTLAKAGLLLRAPQGNQVVYRANQDCPIYEELRGILRKTSGLADVLREALAPLRERVKAAFIYGSVASGEENARSDVDVMIVGEIKFEDAIYALAAAEKTLRREINPHVFQPKEFRAKLSERGGFLERVLDGPKIPLIGDADDLRKSARNRKAKAA
jgi:predicted nucleotidyltransferase